MEKMLKQYNLKEGTWYCVESDDSGILQITELSKGKPVFIQDWFEDNLTFNKRK